MVAGPQCPVVQAGSPCPDAPWNGTIRVTGGDGVDLEVATFNEGRFAIAIGPGTYEVQAVLDGGPRPLRPSRWRCPAQGYVEVALTVDYRHPLSRGRGSGPGASIVDGPGARRAAARCIFTTAPRSRP